MLTDILQKLNSPQAIRTHRQDDQFTRFLNGRLSGSLGLFSNIVGTWTLLLPVIVGLWQLFPYLPRLSGGLTGVLLPFGLLSSLAVGAMFTARRVRRTARTRAFVWLMACYGVATALYLLWMSLGFLRYNTLSSGFLLALTWMGAGSILFRLPRELREIAELVQTQVGQEP